MSHIEEAKGGWPHDSIAHLAPHTPIQVQPDSSQGAFHVMQQGAWRIPVSAQFGNIVNKPPRFGSEWGAPADWGANNNKLGEWAKWTANTEIARPLATFGNSSLTASMMTEQSPVVKEDTPIRPNTEYVSPKEDERKSSEHTNSYDVSASQSPSSHEEEQSSVEMNDNDKNDEQRMEEDDDEEEHKTIEEVVSTNGKIADSSSIEDSQLLLNFSFGNAAKAPIVESNTASSEESSVISKLPLMGFLHSGTSAFSNIEPGLPKAASPQAAALPEPTTPTANLASSASFCRPPGLGPVSVLPPTNGQAAPLVCPICGFSCPSKFHYNSHMNTHGDHQCSMCDYTSRTEGRLKKHMRESHTVEEQLKVGLEIEPKADSSRSSGSPSSPEKEISSDPSSNAFMVNLTTTMASILDSTASALAATMASTEMPPSLPTGLKLDINNTPNLINSLTNAALTSSALDQIRALTENSNLIQDGGLSLASALDVVSQAIGSDSKSPEKQSHLETRRSSGGKSKVLKCKQCQHQSLSKDDQWEHARSHIPIEKQLNCTHCKFVTEYKHHLEYHYRNHLGSKPFRCKKCIYSCVNKSMLNSHMKSHTNHYQFRCMDCTYATKYCHSLKLHLKKYNHRRVPEGIEMNGGDTSPTLSNSDTIQSYPSLTNLTTTSNEKKPSDQTSAPVIAQPQAFNFAPMVTSQSLNYASQMLLKHHQMDGGLNPLLLQNLNTLVPSAMPLKCAMCEVQCASQEEQLRHNMSHFINTSVPTTLASLYSNLSQLPVIGGLPSAANTNETETSMEVDDITDEPDDGSQHDDEDMDQMSDCAHASPTSMKTSSVSCDEEHHKGKSPSSSASVDDKEDTDTHVESSVSPRSDQNSESSSSQVGLPITLPLPEAPLMINTAEPGSLNNLLQQACMAINALQAKQRESSFNNLACPHCKMTYPTQALFNIHMSHHCYEHPFKCSRCEFVGTDSLNFNIHLLQCAHDKPNQN